MPAGADRELLHVGDKTSDVWRRLTGAGTETPGKGTPSRAAPPIIPPGAKMVVMAVLRCENEMSRSGPVEKSMAPLDQATPLPMSRSHTAPTDQAFGSDEGEPTPCAW
jgi:hypothetical protein